MDKKHLQNIDYFINIIHVFMGIFCSEQIKKNHTIKKCDFNFLFLKAILSIHYRINSLNNTFHIWHKGIY